MKSFITFPTNLVLTLILMLTFEIMISDFASSAEVEELIRSQQNTLCSQMNNGDYEIELNFQDQSDQLNGLTLFNIDWSGLGRGSFQEVEYKGLFSDQKLYSIKSKGNDSLSIRLGSGILVSKGITSGKTGTLCLGNFTTDSSGDYEFHCEERYICQKN